jgi:hypothetical protein
MMMARMMNNKRSQNAHLLGPDASERQCRRLSRVPSWTYGALAAAGVCAALIYMWATGAPSAKAQIGFANAPMSLPDVPRRLTTNNTLGELVVPADLRLGTFAVDLGLSLDSPIGSIQKDYMMTSIFASIAGKMTLTRSNQTCDAVFSEGYYPFIRAFMYKAKSIDPSKNARAACVEVIKSVLNDVEVRSQLMRGAVRDIRQLRSSRAARADVALSFPLLVATDSIHEAIRRIYDDRSVIHALLSINADQYESIEPDDFRTWMQINRNRGLIRLLSEDPQMWPFLGTTEAEQMPFLPPMSTRKKPGALVEIKDLDAGAIRAAVLVAVDSVPGAKIRNAAVKKYCREKWNEDAKDIASDLTQSVRTHCLFEDEFGREAWAALYFNADDGPDETLRNRAKEIAADPIVVNLAARESADGEVGHPYVVLFGGQRR